MCEVSIWLGNSDFFLFLFSFLAEPVAHVCPVFLSDCARFIGLGSFPLGQYRSAVNTQTLTDTHARREHARLEW